VKHGVYPEHGSSVPTGNFPMISGRILPKSMGSCRNPPEKIQKIPEWNTASNFLVFSVASRPFPVVRRSPGKHEKSKKKVGVYYISIVSFLMPIIEWISFSFLQKIFY
jgi:hypothetical protein